MLVVEIIIIYKIHLYALYGKKVNVKKCKKKKINEKINVKSVCKENVIYMIP